MTYLGHSSYKEVESVTNPPDPFIFNSQSMTFLEFGVRSGHLVPESLVEPWPLVWCFSKWGPIRVQNVEITSQRFHR